MPILQGKKILVVDKEFGIRESLHIIFKRQGAFTVKAESGEDAVVFLKHNSFDLITTCLFLGYKVMSGIELIKEIRARDIKTPIIVISGNVTLGSMIKCNEFGVVDFISEPFSESAVIRCAEKALADKHKDSQ